MTKFLTTVAVAATVSIAAFAIPASAQMMESQTMLSAQEEVPPTDSAAKGTVDLGVDAAAKKITWTIKSEGLTGPATAAHFHGPAERGANAPPVVDITSMMETGSATLTDQQLADLQAGKLYVNIHTAKFPDGEIRGQIKAMK